MDFMIDIELNKYKTALTNLEIHIEDYVKNARNIEELESLKRFVTNNAKVNDQKFVVNICKMNLENIDLHYNTNVTPQVNVEDLLAGAKEAAKALWEKIKELIQYISNFLKSIYAKILGFVGRYESRLGQLQKDFNNILNKGPIELPSDTWKIIYKYFPILSATKHSEYPVECINIQIMQILDAIMKPFGNVGDIGSEIFKLVDSISTGKAASVTANSNILGSYLKKAESDTGTTLLVLTSVIQDEIKFIGQADSGELQYNKHKMEIKDTSSDSKFIIKKLDIDSIIQKLQGTYIKDLKVFKSAMDKFKSELDTKTKDLINDTSKKSMVMNLIKVSRSFPIDSTVSLYKNLSFTLHLLEGIYKRCSGGDVDIIGNYTAFVEILKQRYPDTTLKYLKGSKELPYVYSAQLMEEAQKYKLAGGFVVIRRGDLEKVPLLSGLDINKDIDIESVIFVDDDLIKQLGGTKLLEFVYYHEMGHAILQQAEGRQEVLFSEKIKDEEKFMDENRDIITELAKIESVEELNKKLKSDSKFKERYYLYQSEVGIKGIDTYLNSYVENQADCHAMLKMGLSLNELAEIRCYILMPILGPHIVQYKENIRKQIPYVKSMAKVSTIAGIKNFLKGNN